MIARAPNETNPTWDVYRKSTARLDGAFFPALATYLQEVEPLMKLADLKRGMIIQDPE